MSGTSLDGLDLALCDFSSQNNKISFNIIESTTYKYTPEWKGKFRNATQLSGFELSLLDKNFGVLTGQFINQFINEYNIQNVDYIASHGHTIFHQPEQQLTLQTGNGIDIARTTNLPVINDFRSLDVSLNGQGAPLVPIGDKLLFPEYDYCLNLGGFSNVSFENKGERIAFDIGPANLPLNHYAEKLGFEFDLNGNLGQKGEIDDNLLNKLNQISYYNQPYPKSLGKEWLDKEFLSLISNNTSTVNVLRTIYEHIAIQIGKVLIDKNSKTLVTGGGTLNNFLISLIQKYSASEIIIPEKRIIEFKEALIFAFLGFLRIKNQTNVLKSVTGASRDSCSGNLIYP